MMSQLAHVEVKPGGLVWKAFTVADLEIRVYEHEVVGRDFVEQHAIYGSTVTGHIT